MKKFYFFLFIVIAFMTSQNQKASAQEVKNVGGHITVMPGAALTVFGSIESLGDSGKIVNDGSVNITGDIHNSNVSKFYGTGTTTFFGDSTQLVLGKFSDSTTAHFDSVVIKKHTLAGVKQWVILGDSLGNSNDSLVYMKKLTFIDDSDTSNRDGIIVTGNKTLVVKTTVDGHQTPNSTGVYRNERYVSGKLARHVATGGTYVFPVGHGTGLYNPMIISITGSGVDAHISVEPQISTGGIGTIYASYTTSCSSYGGINPQWIEEFAMEGEVFWNVNKVFSGNDFDYQVMLHPNEIVGPSNTGNYFRAIKADNALIPSPTADWTPYESGAGRGTPCVAGVLFYEVPGETFNGFSRFGITGNGGETGLPVELISLRADPINNDYIKVSWITATEINNAGFEILRSLDGLHFESIAYQQGAGNSSSQLSYRYDDHDVVKNKVYYYRLRQIDFDGGEEYTYIVSASLIDADHWVISPLLPNPATDEVSFFVETGQDRNMILNVYNTLGQIVSNRSHLVAEGKSQYTITVSDLAAGQYFLSITFADNIFSQKFTVYR